MQNSLDSASSVRRYTNLVHLSDEWVDVLLAIAKITSLNEMPELSRSESTRRVAQLERPQEIARLLEVGANGVDLVNQVLHAHHAVLPKMLLDDGIVGQWPSLLVARLGISALVDQLTHAFEIGVAVCYEWFDDLEHFHRGFGQTNEDAIVDLKQAEELEGLALLGIDLVDTLDTDDEDELGFGRDVVASFLLGDAGEADLLTLGVTVLFDVGLGAFEDLRTLLLVLLRGLLAWNPLELM